MYKLTNLYQFKHLDKPTKLKLVKSLVYLYIEYYSVFLRFSYAVQSSQVTKNTKILVLDLFVCVVEVMCIMLMLEQILTAFPNIELVN